MDFINKIKLPILYNAFADSLKDLDKADIVMIYINEIELELVNNKYKVKLVNFRTTFYKKFKDLFNQYNIDLKNSKQQYDQEVKEKSAQEFYSDKNDKEKDDGSSL